MNTGTGFEDFSSSARMAGFCFLSVVHSLSYMSCFETRQESKDQSAENTGAPHNSGWASAAVKL
jgi:hypothetical protein